MTPGKIQSDVETNDSTASVSAQTRLMSLISSSTPSIEFDTTGTPDLPETRPVLKSPAILELTSRESKPSERPGDRFRSDQADILRGMIEQHFHPVEKAENDQLSNRAFTIAVTSGKGGVGKSLISLNLALAIAREGARVCLIDANLGLGNLDLLCGLNGYWNLSHVVMGSRNLSDVILSGPGGIDLIPGASGLTALADCPPAAQQTLLRQMKQLEESYDVLILDTGTGIHSAVRRFVTAADLVLVITTAEPTAIADAYATIKAIHDDDVSRLEVLVNQCDAEYAHRINERISQTAKMFLHKTVAAAGSIPFDPAMVNTVLRRRPLMVESPQSPAAQSLTLLARRMLTLKDGQIRRPHFFERMWNRLLNRSA